MSAASSKHTGLGNQKKPAGWESPPALPAPGTPEFESWASQGQKDTSGASSGLSRHSNKPRNASTGVNPHAISLNEVGDSVQREIDSDPKAHAAASEAHNDIASDAQFSDHSPQLAPAKTKLGGGEIDTSHLADFQAKMLSDRKARGVPENGAFAEKKAEYGAKQAAPGNSKPATTGTPKITPSAGTPADQPKAAKVTRRASQQPKGNVSPGTSRERPSESQVPKSVAKAEVSAPAPAKPEPAVKPPADQLSNSPDASKPGPDAPKSRAVSPYGRSEAGQGTLFNKGPYAGKHEFTQHPGDSHEIASSDNVSQFNPKMRGQSSMFTGKGEVAAAAKAPRGNRSPSPATSKVPSVTTTDEKRPFGRASQAIDAHVASKSDTDPGRNLEMMPADIAASRASHSRRLSDNEDAELAKRSPKPSSAKPASPDSKIIGGGKSSPAPAVDQPKAQARSRYVPDSPAPTAQPRTKSRSRHVPDSPEKASEPHKSVGQGWSDGGEVHQHVHHYYGNVHIGDNYTNSGNGQQNIGSTVSNGQSGGSSGNSGGSGSRSGQGRPSDSGTRGAHSPRLSYGNPTFAQKVAHTVMNSTVNGTSLNDHVHAATGSHFEQRDRAARRIGDTHSDAHKARNVHRETGKANAANAYHEHEELRHQRLSQQFGS